jgi:hypothetical protein
MDSHVKVLGILYIAAGAILLLIGAGAFFIIAGAGVISGDADAMAVTGLVGTFIAGFFILLSIPSVITGAGLLSRKAWARVLALVLGALQLFNFPFGTALGIYTFWVLLNDQTVPVFEPAAVR